MNKKRKYRYIPEIIVILICIVVSCFAVSKKQGYHMDELLSFELSNAMFNPWIVPTQPQGRLAKFVENEIQGETLAETFGNLVDTVEDVLKNRGSSTLLSYKADVYEEPVWISAEEFADYITVQDGDAFNYLSVYFNVKDDNHPPLHFMLLHTMSSLFRGSAAPMVGCVINIAAVAGVAILLMWLGNRLAVSLCMEEYKRMIGMLAALCYVLSAGALATTLLIRMYAMLTFFCMAFFALHVKKWSEKKFASDNKILIMVTIMGFLTQYFFLFYCLVLAAVTAVLLWKEKRTKELLVYIRSMIISAVIGVGLFPFSIADVFSSGRGVEALNNLSQGLAGFGERIGAFWRILGENTFGMLMLCTVLVIALTWAVMCAVFRRPDRKSEKKPLLWMLTIPMVGFFLLAARMSPYLVDRYIMPLFPFVVLSGILLLFGLAVKVAEKCNCKNIIFVFCGCLLFCQLWNVIRYDGEYLYSGYEIQTQMAESMSEYPCICVYDGVGYYENLVEFAGYEKTLLVTKPELENRQDIASITELDSLVLLVKTNVDMEQVIEIMEEKYGFVPEKSVIRGVGVHGDNVLLMSKVE
uniref:hypothetical protein n=1 Tax=Acetatifactor sp. TaxID=1872090 RepID=UPI004055A02B